MTSARERRREFVIIGAGPAGLTAAHELVKLGFRPTVVEKLDAVGGLARTASYKGFRFDMGGHRFFTKVKEVEELWREILRDDFLLRPRLSRIYYEGRFFHYPLRPLNALAGLGVLQSLLVVLSYLRWQLFPYKHEDTFEQWVTNRFGRRLFRIFFKTYTEKVWGIPCSTLKAEWATQRIKDLSLRTAVLSMFVKPRKTIKTLVETFHYPRLGPGMMWEAMRAEIERQRGVVLTGRDVVRITRTGGRIDGVVVRSADGGESTLSATDFISSMPLPEVIQKLDPPAPTLVRRAADQLKHRDFLTVCLIVKQPDVFPDNWIYVHSPDVRVGRIQNFRSWSPDMVPDPGKTTLGLEYFCTEGDETWSALDADLVELATREVSRIGLVRDTDVEDGCVVRVPKAYPIYDSSYRESLVVIRQFLSELENFQPVGRNGLHRYNNQDHAMLTGMLAVRNTVLGQQHDLWQVNTDEEYHEEIRDTVEATDLEETLSSMFPRLDRFACGVSLGLIAGIGLFVATLVLILRGGAIVGPHLDLLGQFFPGYRVTVLGLFLGLAYGCAAGFVVGWTAAFLRNAILFAYMALTRRHAERQLVRKLLEYF